MVVRRLIALALAALLCASCSQPGPSDSPQVNGQGIQGGEVDQVTLMAARLFFIDTLRRILTGEDAATLCEASEYCRGGANPSLCAMLQALPSATVCRQFIQATAAAMLQLNTQSSPTPFEFVDSALTITLPNGASKHVKATTSLGPFGSIRFHLKSLKDYTLALLSALLGHEFAHKVSYLGRFLADNDIVTLTAASTVTGDVFATAVGAAITLYGLAHPPLAAGVRFQLFDSPNSQTPMPRYDFGLVSAGITVIRTLYLRNVGTARATNVYAWGLNGTFTANASCGHTWEAGRQCPVNFYYISPGTPSYSRIGVTYTDGEASRIDTWEFVGNHQ